MPSQPLVHLDTATHPLHCCAAHFATPQPIIIITAAAATSTTSLLRRRRFEVSPAPPCTHFLTFPSPLHTSSAVAQNSVLVTFVSHVLTHACARWQVTSAVPLCSPVPLQSRFTRGWFARQRVPLCSPALHRCRVSLCCPFLRIPFCSPAFCSYAFCSSAAALQLARLCSPVPLCS